MKLLYKHYKRNNNEFFFYIYWVGHNGFGRPRLSINKKHTDKVKFIFRFTCYKLECYLIKAKL